MLKKIIFIFLAFFVLLSKLQVEYNYLERETISPQTINVITENNNLEELNNLIYFDKQTEYVDSNKDIAIIPKDFAISTRKNENTIKDGLVIIDKNLNEFVFIPTNEKSFNNTINYKEDFKKISKEIKNSNGFFVSRFEIGSEIYNVYDKIYSKQNLYPVIGLELNNINNVINNFSKENNINVMLLQNECYEEILNFISNKSNYKLGNYSNKLNKTGNNLEYKVNNIFDFSGNCNELTIGNNLNENFFLRGGNYLYDTSISNFDEKIPFNSDYYSGTIPTSFRIMFYTK